MMSEQQKIIASLTLGIFLATQLLTFASILMIPKPAQALLGIGDLSVTIGDIPRYLEKIIIGVMRQVAKKISDKFISRFVSKMTEKYKIKNFLYYDRILSNYYLNRFISDKISDPDLRQIYILMEKAIVTGAPTGTSGQPDPKKAIIPQIRAAIDKKYQEQGGVSNSRILNRSSFKSDAEYFMAFRAKHSYPRAAVEQEVNTGFGTIQGAASTAAQLEVLIGNGIKAGRIIGGTCTIKDLPNPTPETCTAKGGIWTPSALDKARSFIDNPTHYLMSSLDSVIQTHTKFNFDPNDFWV